MRPSPNIRLPGLILGLITAYMKRKEKYRHEKSDACQKLFRCLFSLFCRITNSLGLAVKKNMKTKNKSEEKPYNRCLYCQKRNADPTECNGPRTSSMETPRWREYMRDLKEVEGLTYEEISERTGGQLSAASIQNVLAPGAIGDVTREKARLIENAIFGASVAPPCPFDFMAEMTADAKRVAEVEAELTQLRANISRIHDSHEKELLAVREEAERHKNAIRAEGQKKVDYLLSENQRLHKIVDRLLAK